jgi:hypothetical protein
MEKSIDEKMDDMELALKKNRKHGRALASAFLEDESQRIASEKLAKEYVLEKEEETGMQPWMWNTLYFLLGMLFAIVIPSVTTDLIFWLKG